MSIPTWCTATAALRSMSGPGAWPWSCAREAWTTWSQHPDNCSFPRWPTCHITWCQDCPTCTSMESYIGNKNFCFFVCASVSSSKCSFHIFFQGSQTVQRPDPHRRPSSWLGVNPDAENLTQDQRLWSGTGFWPVPWCSDFDSIGDTMLHGTRSLGGQQLGRGLLQRFCRCLRTRTGGQLPVHKAPTRSVVTAVCRW